MSEQPEIPFPTEDADEIDPMDGFVPEPGVGHYGDVQEQDSADD